MMKLKDLKDLRNLDKEDILEMMGLQSKTSTGAYLAGALGTFGVGLLVGAGLGLLLAPKAGRELRDDLRDKFRRIPSDESDTMAAMSGRESPNASKPY
jgi:gas vesicle protein